MKRLFDIIISLLACTLFALPILVIGITIKLTSHGPVIYWSKRVGRNNKEFWMPKLRTMRHDTPLASTDDLVKAEEYITKLGSFLRRYSIDEIPQFTAVLLGNMSIVGPRPVILSQKDIIRKRTELGIHSLKPGITGWAQINGRDNLSMDQKLNFEFEYLQKTSLSFDLYIVFQTIPYVIRSKGIWH